MTVGEESPGDQGERLQKVMAHAGLCSRRTAEDWIAAGRVTVNGEVVTEMGVKVTPSDRVTVGGEPLPPPEDGRYLALHKPIGVISTADDPRGRPTVVDLLEATVEERVYPVGRLDRDSRGLLLLTNDGPLTHRLTHPRFEVGKEYCVVVQGAPADAAAKLTAGVDLDDGPARARRVERLESGAGTSAWRLVMTEGRNREVRRMFAALGHDVKDLKRTAFGPVRLGDLPTGEWRDLTGDEVARLRQAPVDPDDAGG